MITNCCVTLSPSSTGRRCWVLGVWRIVVTLAVLVVAVIFALRGYAPDAVAGPVLVLVVGTVAAVERLAGMQSARSVSVLPV
jgi:hypothetical protein